MSFLCPSVYETALTSKEFIFLSYQKVQRWGTPGWCSCSRMLPKMYLLPSFLWFLYICSQMIVVEIRGPGKGWKARGKQVTWTQGKGKQIANVFWVCHAVDQRVQFEVVKEKETFVLVLSCYKTKFN